MQDFTAYLRVSSVKLIDLTPGQEQVLVKAESQVQVEGAKPAQISLHFLSSPGWAPLPNTVVKVSVEISAPPEVPI